MGWLPFTAKTLWNVNNIILPSWIMIAYDAKSPITKKLNIGASIILSSVYASIMIPLILFPAKRAENAPKMDFFSLEGVVNLFHHANDEAILAAWVHYIIFDCWTAWWMANDYQDTVKFTYATKAYEVFCLFTTMMFGPCGLLFYLGGKYTILPANEIKLKPV